LVKTPAKIKLRSCINIHVIATLKTVNLLRKLSIQKTILCIQIVQHCNSYMYISSGPCLLLARSHFCSSWLC